MERHIWLNLSVLVAIIAVTICIHECDARFGGLRNRNKELYIRRYPKIKYFPSPTNRRVVEKPLNLEQLERHGFGDFSSYFNSAAGAAHMPPGSVYYPYTATMPPRSIYAAKRPRRSSAGALLFDITAGQSLFDLIFRPPQSVKHAYEQYLKQSKQHHVAKIVVSNDGTATVLDSKSREAQSLSPLWPPDDGIICMPIRLNRINLDDKKNAQEVKLTICFPAPSPPPEVTGDNCVKFNLLVRDPNDTAKTIKLPRELCTTPTTTATTTKATTTTATTTTATATTTLAMATTTMTIEPLEVSSKISESVSSEAENNKESTISQKVKRSRVEPAPCPVTGPILLNSEEVKEQERRRNGGRSYDDIKWFKWS